MQNLAPIGLPARLAEAAPRLTARVLDEMYANPFWQERFGERGRRHARNDGDYHLTYVAEAVAAGDDRVFTKYATWLRDVLTSRGMCSRHLAENFERLASAVAGEAWPDGERAIAVLHAGAVALRHTSGDAALLDEHSTTVAAAATTALYAAHPEWLDAGGHAGRARCYDDLTYHLSYLADALAAERRPSFTAHAQFVAGMLARSGLPAANLGDAFTALARGLAGVPGLSPLPAAWLVEAAAAVTREERAG
jgi:hypothetical protein